MADGKMTKEKFLARRAATIKSPVDSYLERHPFMDRAEVEEMFRIEALPAEEQQAFYNAQAKAQLKINLLTVDGVDSVLADLLVTGGVKYFHTIASSLPYERFHGIAHMMIGSPIAGC